MRGIGSIVDFAWVCAGGKRVTVPFHYRLAEKGKLVEAGMLFLNLDTLKWELVDVRGDDSDLTTDDYACVLESFVPQSMREIPRGQLKEVEI